MSNSPNSNFKDIAKELPLKEAYQDIIHPSAAAIGQAISLPIRAVNVLLSPIAKWVIQGEARLEEISRSVGERVKDVPPEKLVEPEPYVAVPAMQALTYSMDSNELKNLYANLLSNAINIDKKDKVLPAYVEIIRQMSPLDAKSLEFIQKGGRTAIALCDIRWQKKSSPLWSDFKFFRLSSYGSFLYRNYVAADEDGYTANDITISFENLDRLGLIEINPELQLDKEQYKKFDDNYGVIYFANRYAENSPHSNEYEVALLPSSAQITNLGKAFSSICFSSSNQ